MYIFKQFFAYLRLREAVRKADEAYRASGNRHYVIPAHTPQGGSPRLMVIDRSNFRILKRKRYITSKAMTCDLAAESFYFTPFRDGSGRIPERVRRDKVRQYFAWYAACL